MEVPLFGWEGWFTIGVLLASFTLLLLNWAPADFTMILALALVMTAQIITTTEGLEGFASSSVLSVAMLYIVAECINLTGVLEYYFNKVMGSPKMLASAQLRMMVPVALFSAFLNNTPVVAIMIPIVHSYAQRIKQPVSQFFIPLSFASILGGTCTLIGTSTNLVLADKFRQSCNESLPVFEIGKVGVPVLFSGLSYIIIFSPWLLPSFKELRRRSLKSLGYHSQSSSGDSSSRSDFTFGCLVSNDSAIVGKTVDDALADLEELYLMGIERNHIMVNENEDGFVVKAGDVLFFTGDGNSFHRFCEDRKLTIMTEGHEYDKHKTIAWENGPDDSSFSLPNQGSSDSLDSPESDPSTKGERSKESLFQFDSFKKKLPHDEDFKLPRHCRNLTAHSAADLINERVTKVVVRSGSQLVGHTALEAHFRAVYDAAIISLYRAGTKKIFTGHANDGHAAGNTVSLGRIPLEVGDVLLIMSGDDFSWDNEATSRDLKPLKPNFISCEGNDQNPRNLPENDWIQSQSVDIEREFLLQMRVKSSSPLIGASGLSGKTVESAGLRGLPGLFLVAVLRVDGTMEHVVGPDCILQANDLLWFAGDRDSLTVLRRIPGLQSPEDHQAQKLDVKPVNRRLVECVLSMRSSMVGKTVREAKFRTIYDAAVVAVHRQGQRVLHHVGEIEFRGGDVLILDTGPLFIKRHRDDENFLLVTEIDNSTPPRFSNFYISATATAAAMASFVIWGNDITLFEPTVFAVSIMIVFGCISTESARASISWPVILTIASAFGLSNAMKSSGVADTIGLGMVYLGTLTGTGYFGVICALYAAGFLISIVIANNATALLLFPIAMGVSPSECPIDPETDRIMRQMLYTIMLSSSSSFSTPYGYQTNMMVLDCGQYVFKDFLRFGFPMQIWQMVVSVIVVWYIDFWYLCWVASMGLFFICVGARVSMDSLKQRWKPERDQPLQDPLVIEVA